MRSLLTVAVAQPRCRAHDLATNARLHAEAIVQARARVVVFPEMSLTGYHFDAAPVSIDDPRLQPVVAACRAHDSVGLAGAPVDDGDGRRFIAMLKIDARGVSVAYRKMFLGSAERAHFHPGPTPTALEIDGRRLGLAICKDTGVSQHAAMTAALDIDLYVAGVLETAEDADVQPTRAQRIVDDHGVWVAVASFAGATGEGFDPAAGGSAIWRPDGSLADVAGTDVGAIARVVVV